MSPDRLSVTFSALADPTRRAILARLASGAASVGELAEPFAMSLPAVSKHLKVLECAGLIARGREAQWRPCRLDAGPLEDVSDWVAHYNAFRSDLVSYLSGCLFRPALPDSSQEFRLVLLHKPDKRLIRRIFVCGRPEHHFREDRRESNALRRERVNQFAPVRGVSSRGDDSMSHQLLQAIGQNI